MKLFAKLALASALAAPTMAFAAPLNVVTSFTVISDLVKNVGGDDVNVDTVVGANADLHHFEPQPETMKFFEATGDNQVKLFFINGLELEPWADKITKSAKFQGETVDLSKGVKLAKMSENPIHDDDEDEHDHDHHDHEHEHHDHEHTAHEGHHHHHHGEYDPHIWQSPANAVIMVKNIENALVKADPDHADNYHKNAEKFTKELQELDENIKKQYADIPEDKRVIGTNHDAFGYYAREYGITQIPVGGLGEAEPSAQDVAAAIKDLKAKNARAVFLENTKNDKLIRQVAKDADIKVGGELYSDALGDSGETSTYIGMMKYNTKTIVSAIK